MSDKNTLYQRGFFIASNLFYGERHDYSRFDRKWNTLEAETHGWAEPEIVPAPLSEYYVQKCPSDRVIETLKPELVKKFDEYSVYKVERNITGYPVIRCNDRSEHIYYECAEELKDDFNIDNIRRVFRHNISETINRGTNVVKVKFCKYFFVSLHRRNFTHLCYIEDDS